METVFDAILARKISCKPVYEDDTVLAFHDIKPVAPVHVLVIPKKKFHSFAELSSGEDAYVGDYMKKIAHVATVLGLDETGYRVVFNHGLHGAQTVAYVHAHILGGRMLEWPPG